MPFRKKVIKLTYKQMADEKEKMGGLFDFFKGKDKKKEESIEEIVERGKKILAEEKRKKKLLKKSWNAAKRS